ncbi:hypothetical protein NB723_000113 [Xanthomonas sacchari]|nr:hypothetical protein [Xanthomonas sacchari]
MLENHLLLQSFARLLNEVGSVAQNLLRRRPTLAYEHWIPWENIEKIRFKIMDHLVHRSISRLNNRRRGPESSH